MFPRTENSPIGHPASATPLVEGDGLVQRDEIPAILTMDLIDRGMALRFGPSERPFELGNPELEIEHPLHAGQHLEFDVDDWQSIKKGITKQTIFPKQLRG